MKILLFLLLVSFKANAMDLSGCGEYKFKGILRKFDNRLVYLVHEQTKSQMVFEIENMEDTIKLASFLDKESSFNAVISKAMNGTKGSFKNVSNISAIFPEPLEKTDTGLDRIKSFKCTK